MSSQLVYNVNYRAKHRENAYSKLMEAPVDTRSHTHAVATDADPWAMTTYVCPCEEQQNSARKPEYPLTTEERKHRRQAVIVKRIWRGEKAEVAQRSTRRLPLPPQQHPEKS